MWFCSKTKFRNIWQKFVEFLQIGLDWNDNFFSCCFKDEVMVVFGIFGALCSSLTMKLIILCCFVVLCKLKKNYSHITTTFASIHIVIVCFRSFNESKFTMITMYMNFMEEINGLFWQDPTVCHDVLIAFDILFSFMSVFLSGICSLFQFHSKTPLRLCVVGLPAFGSSKP